MKANTDEVRRLLRNSGIARTAQRIAITSTLFELGRHVDATALHRAVCRRGSEIGRATVYRTLQLLRDRGLVAEREFGDGLRRYEPKIASHHDHLICLGCDRVLEFEEPSIEALQAQVALRHDFKVIRHRLELYGYCRNCEKKLGGKASRREIGDVENDPSTPVDAGEEM